MVADMKMIRSNPIKFAALVIIFLMFCLVGVYFLYSWNQPLGEPLQLPTLTLTPDGPPGTTTGTPFQPGPTLTVVPDATSTPIFTSTPTLTHTPVYTPTPEPVCGGPNTMNLLLVGVANRDSLYGLADAIRVVHIDFRTMEISVVPFPRDLWVDIPITIPGATDGVTPGKINQAYYYGTNQFNYFKGSGGGAGLLAETMLYDFGLPIDHYVVVNMDSFRTIIDQLGGIDACFSDNIYRKRYEEPVLYLPAGCHHLNGEQAEVVARQRINIGDLGRIQHQTILLKALAVKLLSPTGIAQLPDIVSRLKGYVALDFSPAEISQLICLAGKIDRENDISYGAIPDERMVLAWRYDPVRRVWTSVLAAENAYLRYLMEEFQKGLWP